MLQRANLAMSEANRASHLSALLFFQLLALKIETHLRKYFQLPCDFVIDQLKSTISAIVVIPQLGQFSDQLPLLGKYNLTASSQILLFKE